MGDPAAVTPLTATNGKQTTNLWQATPGYFPNYPTYLQTYGGVGAPYADIGAQIRDAMQNSGLLSGAPPNPLGGNAAPRYQFGRSAIAQNQVPNTPGMGVPHGLLGSAAQSSIFNQYIPQQPGSNTGNIPQGGYQGGNAPGNYAGQSGGLLHGDPAPIIPPSAPAGTPDPTTKGGPGGLNDLSKGGNPMMGGALPAVDPNTAQTVNVTNGQSPGASYQALIAQMNALPTDAAKFHFLSTTGSGLLGGGVGALAQANFGGDANALRQWQQTTANTTMNGAYDPASGQYASWFTGK